MADTTYYELLGVEPEADDSQLKKGYRTQAIKWHPDKNPAPDAEEKFREITNAYRVLSNSSARASYDKYGKKSEEDNIHQNTTDFLAFFANVFGGDAFRDYIGDVNLMTTIASPAEVEVTPVSSVPAPADYEEGSLSPMFEKSEKTSPSDLVPRFGDGSGGHTVPSQSAAADLRTVKRNGTTRKAEQRELQEKWQKELERQVAMLSSNLKERIAPFVNVGNPDDVDDLETISLQEKIRNNADDLKIECFGVEILHTIGIMYITKSTSSLKSRQFLGIPGFFSRLMERGVLAKEVWNLAAGFFSARMDTEQLRKAQLPQVELQKIESALPSKILLACWRDYRYRINRVLRAVLDNVLYEKGLKDDVLVKRAKAIMLIGMVFKSVQSDEPDEDRRSLERLVAELVVGKMKKHNNA